MTQRIEKTMALITGVQTAEQAVSVIADAHPHLSKQAATNVVKDLQDFAAKTMELSELDFRLAEAGL